MVVLLLFAGILLGALVTVLWGAVISWPVMLLFGAVHSFLPVIPAFGFWQTLAIVLLIRLILPSPSSTPSSSSR